MVAKAKTERVKYREVAFVDDNPARAGERADVTRSRLHFTWSRILRRGRHTVLGRGLVCCQSRVSSEPQESAWEAIAKLTFGLFMGGLVLVLVALYFEHPLVCLSSSEPLAKCEVPVANKCPTQLLINLSGHFNLNDRFGGSFVRPVGRPAMSTFLVPIRRGLETIQMFLCITQCGCGS
jgi:hypothetical protein